MAKVLVNCLPDEARYLKALEYMLAQQGHTGASTTKTLTATELVAVA